MAKSQKHQSLEGHKPLPFEPQTTQKQSSKKQTASPRPASKARGIPPVVSQRMARRMALFCGIPSLLGFLTMPAGYLIITNDWLKLPNAAVILVSMGFLGLGVLGLSYGVFSASWDEERSGTRLGFQEFKLNLGRTIEAWRSSKAQGS